MTFFGRIILLFLVISCASQQEYANPSKLSFFNSPNKKTFSFAVDEQFVSANSKSKPSTLYSKMNTAELKLLMRSLADNRYCINKDGELSFKITSKQEKVYDVTFSSVIEQNYNARPISPTTYFGECL